MHSSIGQAMFPSKSMEKMNCLMRATGLNGKMRWVGTVGSFLRAEGGGVKLEKKRAF